MDRSRPKAYLVHEDVYLVNASSPKAAWKEAEIYAREACVDDPSLTIGGHPSVCVFAGFRKVVSVSHRGKNKSLRSGDEVTYSAFQVPDLKSVRKLARGKAVSVEYID